MGIIDKFGFGWDDEAKRFTIKLPEERRRVRELNCYVSHVEDSRLYCPPIAMRQPVAAHTGGSVMNGYRTLRENWWEMLEYWPSSAILLLSKLSGSDHFAPLRVCADWASHEARGKKPPEKERLSETTRRRMVLEHSEASRPVGPGQKWPFLQITGITRSLSRAVTRSLTHIVSTGNLVVPVVRHHPILHR